MQQTYEFHIRQAELSDASHIAKIHVESWKTTYKNIVNESYLSELKVDKSTKRWKEILTEKNSKSAHHVLVNSNQLIGFVSSGPNRDTGIDCDAELYAIYLDKDFHGLGLGKKLFNEALNNLKQRNYIAMLTWALEDNHPARRFYENCGGIKQHEKPEEFGTQVLKEIGYVWKLDCLVSS